MYLVKDPPAMWETWVQSPGWEDSLEKGKAIHSSILAWRIPWTVYPRGCKESDMTEWLSLHFFKVKSQCPLRAQSKGGWWTRAMTTCIWLNTLALSSYDSSGRKQEQSQNKPLKNTLLLFWRTLNLHFTTFKPFRIPKHDHYLLAVISFSPSSSF